MMPRPCTACAHPKKEAIDHALIAGITHRALAKQYGVSVYALLRHQAAHLPETLRHAKEEVEVTHALNVVAQLHEINAESRAILHDARQSHDLPLALRAIDRIHKQVELQAKLLGDLDERPTVNLTVSAEWVAIRTRLMQALAPYPEARLAVAACLQEVSHDCARFTACP